MYYVYVLRSKSSGRHYIGQTNDLKRRLVEHNRGKHKATKNRGPWELLAHIDVSTRSEAVRLEAKLKSMKRPDRALRYIEKNVNNSAY